MRNAGPLPSSPKASSVVILILAVVLVLGVTCYLASSDSTSPSDRATVTPSKPTTTLTMQELATMTADGYERRLRADGLTEDAIQRALATFEADRARAHQHSSLQRPYRPS